MDNQEVTILRSVALAGARERPRRPRLTGLLDTYLQSWYVFFYFYFFVKSCAFSFEKLIPQRQLFENEGNLLIAESKVFTCLERAGPIAMSMLVCLNMEINFGANIFNVPWDKEEVALDILLLLGRMKSFEIEEERSILLNFGTIETRIFIHTGSLDLKNSRGHKRFLKHRGLDRAGKASSLGYDRRDMYDIGIAS